MPASRVNLVNPSGKLVSLPGDQVNSAFMAGYTSADGSDLEHFEQQELERKNEEKYGTLSQQALTFVEGAAKAATLGLSGFAEQGLNKLGVEGFTPEDIQGRQRTNPLLSVGSEIAGLANPITGTGALLTRAGTAGARLLGLGASGIGSSAVRMAIEGAAFQSGNEVYKAFIGDPDQTIDTALADVKLAGLWGGALGAGTGALGKLWQAASETKLAGKLGKIVKQVNSGATPEAISVESPIDDAIAKSGLEVDPIVKAALDGDIQGTISDLSKSSAIAGKKVTESLDNFQNQIAENISNTLKKTPKDVEFISNLDNFEFGQKVEQSLAKKIKDDYLPMGEKFEEVYARLGASEVIPALKGDISDKLESLRQTEGYGKFPGTAEGDMLDRTIVAVSEVNTAKDLANIQTEVGRLARKDLSKSLNQPMGQINSILREAEEATMDMEMDAFFPEGVTAEHKILRKDYRALMENKSEIEAILGMRPSRGIKGFTDALSEMPAESILKKLSDPNQARILTSVLPKAFPETFEIVKDYQINRLLKGAIKREGANYKINPDLFFKRLNEMPRTVREIVFTPESLDSLASTEELMSRIPKDVKAISDSWGKEFTNKYAPVGAAAMGTMLISGNPIMGGIIGGVAAVLGKEAPDATRLAIAKLLASPESVNATAFKTMVNTIDAALKGQTKIQKAIKEIFKPGLQVLPSHLIPDEKDRKKIDQKVMQFQLQPEKMLELSDSVSDYTPEQGKRVAELSMNAVNYLANLRPAPSKLGPLNKELPPGPLEMASYHRTLDMVNQPLLILSDVKSGRVRVQDLKALTTIYPSLYNKLAQNMTNELIDVVSKGEEIPYQTRLGLSLFLGQPMDSTMTPQSIQAIQAGLQVSLMQKEDQSIPGAHGHRSLKDMEKLVDTASTDSQAREADRWG